MAPQQINWVIYNSLPPDEAQHQLTHIHDNRRASIAAAYATCLPMAFIAIVMRFLSRRIGRVKYGADDWMIIVAYLLAVAYAVPALLAGLKYGGGRHMILMAEKDPIHYMQTAFAGELAYPSCIATVKISTLLLYTRIFPARKFRRYLWAIGIFIITYTFVMLITAIFQCRPIEAAWNLDPRAKCIKITTVWMVMGAMNVLTDVLLLLVPIPQLWALQMRRDTKFGIIGIFSIGGFVTVVSIYRIFKLTDFTALDESWSATNSSIWSCVEVCVAIICACAITYRPLFNWIFHIRSSSSGATVRTARPRPIGTHYPQGNLIRSTSSQDSGLSMEDLKPPASSHGSSRPSKHEEGFHRIADSTDV